MIKLKTLEQLNEIYKRWFYDESVETTFYHYLLEIYDLSHLAINSGGNNTFEPNKYDVEIALNHWLSALKNKQKLESADALLNEYNEWSKTFSSDGISFLHYIVDKYDTTDLEINEHDVIGIVGNAARSYYFFQEILSAIKLFNKNQSEEETTFSELDESIDVATKKIKDKVEPVKHNHYFRPCPYDSVDVYRVLEIFNVTDPCIQHAVKKLLVAGGRGHKDISKDIQDVIDTCVRWQQMKIEEGNNIV